MEEMKNENGEKKQLMGIPEDEIKENVESILNTAVEVIKNPAGFFAGMKKTGGFKDPLIFMVAMGVVTGCVRIILSLFGLGYTGSFVGALFSVIVVPLFVAVFGFLAAALFYIVWKVMGSKESYETAYRCIAYASAITPIVSLVGPVPYIGAIAGNLWSMYIMVTASMTVHSIEKKKAWIVFGALCFVLSVSAINTERAAHEMAQKMERWEQEFGDMSPEEAGKVFGDFIKGVDQSKGQ
jgi:hypothetical protein